MSNKDETKYIFAIQKAPSSSFLNCCIKKKKIPRTPLQLSRFLQVGLAQTSNYISLIFIDFALNSVEAREGMPLLSFLNDNRENILVTLSFLVW